MQASGLHEAGEVWQGNGASPISDPSAPLSVFRLLVSVSRKEDGVVSPFAADPSTLQAGLLSVFVAPLKQKCKAHGGSNLCDVDDCEKKVRGGGEKPVRPPPRYRAAPLSFFRLPMPIVRKREGSSLREGGCAAP